MKKSLFVLFLGLVLLALVIGLLNLDKEVSASPAPAKFSVSPSKQCTATWGEHPDNPIIEFEDFIPGVLWNDPSIVKEGNIYKMWVSGGENIFSQEIRVSVYQATSSDGIDWDMNTNPVIEPGIGGSWDDLRIETPSVIKVGDTYHLYYSGCNTEVCGTGVYSIGHATSPDGINWEKDTGNPLIVPGQGAEWGTYTVAEPGIVYNSREEKYYLYYVSAGYNYQRERIEFGILLSTSDDGSNFEPYVDNQGKKKPVLLISSNYPHSYEGVSTPMALISENGKFHLFYDVVKSIEGFQQIAISHATSRDGKNFQEKEVKILENGGGDWKDYQVLAPTVIKEGNRFKIWFSGQQASPGENFNFGVGYAESNDVCE